MRAWCPQRWEDSTGALQWELQMTVSQLGTEPKSSIRTVRSFSKESWVRCWSIGTAVEMWPIFVCSISKLTFWLIYSYVLISSSLNHVISSGSRAFIYSSEVHTGKNDVLCNRAERVGNRENGSDFGQEGLVFHYSYSKGHIAGLFFLQSMLLNLLFPFDVQSPEIIIYFLQILVQFHICILCREFTGHCISISTSEVGFWKGWSRHSLEFSSKADRNRCCPENAPRPLHLSHSGDLRCGTPLSMDTVSGAGCQHRTWAALLESSHTLEDAEDSR